MSRSVPARRSTGAAAATDLPSILLLEDDAGFAQDMQVILSAAARVTWVRDSARAAVELLRRRPDLLWIDLDLEPCFGPVQSLEGLAFLRLVRERIDAEVTVIVVSSHASTLEAGLLESLGVRAVLGKPPDLRVVFDLLKRPGT